MKILLTGASGFLGKVIQDNLENEHEIITIGRSNSSILQIDLSSEIPKLPKVDLVIHAAGKAHVIPKTQQEKQEFFNVNVQGTINLLNGITHPPKAIIFISSVSVYGVDNGIAIQEDHPLNGDSPYAISKIEAEKLVRNYAESHGVNFLILRIPLIVGKEAPGNFGAIIKAIRSGYYFRLGDGNAKKSMVLAEDIARAIPSFIGYSGIFHLTDGHHPSLAQLDSYLADKLGKKVKQLPLSLLRFIGRLGDYIPGFPLNSYRIDKLSQNLTFSDQKARKVLGWKSRPVIGTFKP